MCNITLISTIHKENGKCNADELHRIIEEISPEVIFLEALESCYTEYSHRLFATSDVYNKRLEISAIQKYSHKHTFEYIPVLDDVLPDEFEERAKIVCENYEYQKLLITLISMENKYGFQFLNSKKNIELQEEMRKLEKHILSNNELWQKVDGGIDAYENSMIRNIYAYCKDNQFNTAIFMCGAAHRKSIIEKIEKYKTQENISLNWRFYGNSEAE